MKKSILSTTLFASLLILFFTACTKEMPSSELGTPGKYTPDVITTDESLAAFNDAMIRFDPLYLQVMFKESKTREQIQEASKDLLIEFNKDPNNIAVQKELVDLYHFENLESLQNASDALTQNALLLKNQYFNNQESPTTKQRLSFFEARKKYLQNKLNALEKAKQKKATGLWNDMADEIERQFHYYTLVYNEEFESDMNGGGAECNESCCLELKTCTLNAKNNYYNYVFKNINNGMTSLASWGFFTGIALPIIGSTTGVMAGGFIGGIGGLIISNEIFQNEIRACLYNYKSCIERKNNN